MNAANPNMTKIEMERSLKLNRSRKNLRRDVGKAIADYSMIEHGDKVMVCLSGIVKCAFILSPEQQSEITQVLLTQLPNHSELTFMQDANLIGGIELLGNGSKISWNITDYLSELDLNIEHLLDHKFRSQE